MFKKILCFLEIHNFRTHFISGRIFERCVKCERTRYNDVMDVKFQIKLIIFSFLLGGLLMYFLSTNLNTIVNPV